MRGSESSDTIDSSSSLKANLIVGWPEDLWRVYAFTKQKKTNTESPPREGPKSTTSKLFWGRLERKNDVDEDIYMYLYIYIYIYIGV